MTDKNLDDVIDAENNPNADTYSTQGSDSADAPTSDGGASWEQPFSDPNAFPNPFGQQGYTQAPPTQDQMPRYDQPQDAQFYQQPYDQQYSQQPYGQQPYDQQYGQQPYDQQYGQPGMPQYQQGGTNPGTVPLVLGIIALVLSIFFFPTFVGPIVGIVLAAIGISKASKILRVDPNNGRARGGKITSIIGLIVSILATIMLIVGMVMVFMFAAQLSENPEGIISQLEELSQYDETGQLDDALDQMKEELGIEDGKTGAGSTGTTDTTSSTGAAGTTNSASSTGATDSTDAQGAGAGDTSVSPDSGATMPATSSLFSVPMSSDRDADMRSLAESVLDSVNNPTDEQKASFEEYFNGSFDSLVGVSIDELGMTEKEYTDWATGDFTYSIQNVTTTESFGMVDATVKVRDFDQLYTVFGDILAAPETTQKLEKTESMEDYYRMMGDVLREAMAQTEKVERQVTVDASCDGKNWMIDDWSLNYLYSTLYGLY